MSRRGVLILVSLVEFGLASGADSTGVDSRADSTGVVSRADSTGLTLEELFPKDGLFGPEPRSAAFSSSGRFAAYLHRTYSERRHGDDVWLFEADSCQVRRLTSVELLERYQSSARKALADRKERTGSPAVAEDDAKSNGRPRYSGVSGFVWSPTEDALIFSSEGDLYFLRIGEESGLVRLTRSADDERSFRFLPDGRGYTCIRDRSILRVRFDSHVVEEIQAQLPGAQELRDYCLSPDGTRLVTVTTSGEKLESKASKVPIIQYRDRFAEVKTLTRHVSDDPIPAMTSQIRVLDLARSLEEGAEPVEIFSLAMSGPRDVVKIPVWSDDSERFAFSVYSQAEQEVSLYEVAWKPGSAPEDERLIYRLLHRGGPNTPGMIEPEYMSDGRRLVFLTELSGFRQLHLLDPRYEQLDQLTRGRFEVYPFALSKDRRSVFATSTLVHPSELHLVRIDLEDGRITRLSPKPGVYSSPAVSPDGRYLVAVHADSGAPAELVAIAVESATETRLTSSHPEESVALTKELPEFFSITNRHGQEIYGQLFRPKGWTAEDKRPLLVYVYGGPLGTRKMVSRGSFSGSGYLFARYMTEKYGYVTCTIDPRGVSGYGGLYERANFEQVGKPQCEDLVDLARWFSTGQGVDSTRIGLHGWSFGGFQTQMCLYTEPEVFACGIAGAGPTEWENYNSWYSTGTIGESRPGSKDLQRFSLLPLAKELKRPLLLVHGMEDNNVLFQDTVRVYGELLRAGKETLVELFLDPRGGHHLGGDIESLAMYRKYEAFLIEHLGSGVP